MRKFKLTLLVLAGLTLGGFSFVNNEDQPKDYLNVPGPISFYKTKFNLAWSSHPIGGYYKQEYLPKGDNLKRFDKMVLIDVLADTLSLKNVVFVKIAELQKRKEQSDPVVNYKVFHNPDSSEYILDFVVSQGSPTLDFVEWNAYRYKSFTDNAGNKGIMIFGISMRSYGSGIREFFGSLKDTRGAVIKELINYKIPDVTLSGDQ